VFEDAMIQCAVASADEPQMVASRRFCALLPGSAETQHVMSKLSRALNDQQVHVELRGPQL